MDRQLCCNNNTADAGNKGYITLPVDHSVCIKTIKYVNHFTNSKCRPES